MNQEEADKIAAKISLKLDCAEGLRKTIEMFRVCGLDNTEIIQLFNDAIETMEPVRIVRLN